MSSLSPNDTTTITPTLYIIYNAKSTMYGKLNYVYRKVTCPDPASRPACAACELTHGPSLRLSESPKWIETKQRIHDANVVQVHQDEMPAPLRTWMNNTNVSTPAVVVGLASRSNNDDDDDDDDDDETAFKVLLKAEDLALVWSDHEEFLVMLAKKAREEGVPGIVIDSARI